MTTTLPTTPVLRERREGVVHFDGGGQAPGPTVAAAWISTGEVTDELVAHFPGGTHNTAEWSALLLGLTLARKWNVTHLTVRGDSQLIIKQAGGEYRVKAAALKPLHEAAMKAAADFEEVTFEWVRREENKRADELGRAELRAAAGRGSEHGPA